MLLCIPAGVNQKILDAATHAMILLMIPPLTNVRTRSYWHIALQWLSGVLLFISLSACLLLYNLAGLTERPMAISLSTAITSRLFDQSGLANQLNFGQLKQLAPAVPDGTTLSIPQFPAIRLSKQDILALNQTQLSTSIFSQISSSIYDKGVDGTVSTFASDPATQKSVSTQAAPLNLFTKSTHDLLQRLFTITLAISITLAALLSLLSVRWGRLASVGLVLLLVSPVGVAAALLLTHTGLASQLSSLAPPTVIQTVSEHLTHSYLYAALAGLALLAIAGIGKLITSAIGRSRTAAVAPRTTN